MTGGAIIKRAFVRRRRAVVLGSLFWASHQTCEALVPVAIGLIIDRAVASSDGSLMLQSIGALLLLFFVLTMSWRSGFWFVTRGVLEETHALRLEASRRILSPAGIATDRQTGELLSITSSDAEATPEVLEAAARVGSALVGLGVSAFVLFRIHWVLGVVVMLGVPLLMLGLHALSPWVERRTAARQQGAGMVAALAADLLRGLRPLRGFGGEPVASRRYRTSSREALDATIGAVKATSGFLGATTFTAGLLLAIVAAVAGTFALQGRITIGELITVVGLAAFVSDPVRSIADCVFRLATSRASAARIAELLSAPVRAGGGQEELHDGDVVFSHVTSGPLDDVSFDVAENEVVGVATGDLIAADTVAQLLQGRRRPEQGTVQLGTVELADATPAALRSHVLVEPHTVDLFGETLRDALVTGNELSDVEVHGALQASAAEGLTAGLDRELLDHGTNLSGGQRQRVALARGLLADRPVMVLRDPTTAVDAVTESTMADGIRERRAQGTRRTIMITTSPPLLARCDRILFLDEGRVSLQGSHADLLDNEAYAKTVLR